MSQPWTGTPAARQHISSAATLSYSQENYHDFSKSLWHTNRPVSATRVVTRLFQWHFYLDLSAPVLGTQLSLAFRKDGGRSERGGRLTGDADFTAPCLGDPSSS